MSPERVRGSASHEKAEEELRSLIYTALIELSFANTEERWPYFPNEGGAFGFYLSGKRCVQPRWGCCSEARWGFTVVTATLVVPLEDAKCVTQEDWGEIWRH